MSKLNTDSNRSSMCRRTYKKRIGNTNYIVKSMFKTSGPTIVDCIKTRLEFKIGEITENEKDTHPI